MTEQISRDLLLHALKSSDKPHGRGGETLIDEIVRLACYDSGVRDTIEGLLPGLIDELEGESWHALHILVGQSGITAPHIGEKIDQKIAGKRLEPIASIWAGQCVRLLGANLSSDSVRALEAAAPISPLLWFALIQSTQDRALVEHSLIELAGSATLSADTLTGLVRSYKRWATANRFEWNAVLSKLFDRIDNVAPEPAVEAIASAVGFSFADRVRSKGRRIGPVPRLSSRVYSRVERVVENIEWSRAKAVGGPGLAAA